MTVTIELAPDLDTRLQEAAARQGQDPATFARAAVEEKLRRLDEEPTNGHTGANGPDGITLEEEERLLDELSLGSETLPILPPEANRREWIYNDHD